MSTTESVKQLLLQGTPKTEIAKLLGISKTTVSYHAERHGFGQKRSKDQDWSSVQDFYDQGHTIRATCRKFGIRPDRLYTVAHQGMITLRPSTRAAVADFFHGSGPKTDRRRLKSLIIKHKLLLEECSICQQQPLWQGKRLALQLDHIDGNPLDNKLSNLRFLCPNCHTQTETWGIRNSKAFRNRQSKTP